MSAAVELRIGCVGYSYDFWVGPFYPRHTPQSEFLKLYSKVFDLVEIDSTFYTIPPPATIRSWRDSVPNPFLFAAKLPRVITHENAMRPTREALDRFYRSIGELRPKVATLPSTTRRGTTGTPWNSATVRGCGRRSSRRFDAGRSPSSGTRCNT